MVTVTVTVTLTVTVPTVTALMYDTGYFYTVGGHRDGVVSRCCRAGSALRLAAWYTAQNTRLRADYIGTTVDLWYDQLGTILSIYDYNSYSCTRTHMLCLITNLSAATQSLEVSRFSRCLHMDARASRKAHCHSPRTSERTSSWRCRLLRSSVTARDARWRGMHSQRIRTILTSESCRCTAVQLVDRGTRATFEHFTVEV